MLAGPGVILQSFLIAALTFPLFGYEGWNWCVPKAALPLTYSSSPSPYFLTRRLLPSLLFPPLLITPSLLYYSPPPYL